MQFHDVHVPDGEPCVPEAPPRGLLAHGVATQVQEVVVEGRRGVRAHVLGEDLHRLVL